MIVVLASRLDREALGLARAWAEHGARVMTPDDLSMAGWRVLGSDVGDARLVAGGSVIRADEVSGVVTRLMTVTGDELTRLREQDSAYAAREMSAFLGYWLSTLTCTVLNPPGAVSLCGPGWRDERWLVVARDLGIEVVPRVRRVVRNSNATAPADSGVPLADVGFTVIGSTCVPVAAPGGRMSVLDPDTEAQAAAYARMLAEAAGVPMLTVGFASTPHGLAFVGASPRSAVSDPQIQEAMLGYLVGLSAAAAGRRGPA